MERCASTCLSLGCGANLVRSIWDISRAEMAGLYDVDANVLDRSDDPARDLSRLAGISRLMTDSRAYLKTCISWRREITEKQDQDAQLVDSPASQDGSL
ncbi:hypothetical protein ACJ5NV_07765 [Loktanella agnita]|uniref:hypothetical protein n=1 Tax=Loktanella agnita TaxID=287097 RepID=UPI00398604B5